MASVSEEGGHGTDGDTSTLATVHRAVFTVAVLATLAMYGVMMGEMLTFAVTGWVTEPGVHHVHELTLFGTLWLGIAGLAVQVYRPTERVNAVLVSALVLVPLAVMAVTTDSPIAMMPLLFGALGLLAVVLHPAGRSLLGAEWGRPGHRELAGLLAIAVLPVAVFAADQVALQYSSDDAHAQFVHYGGMAVATGLVWVLGLLATVRTRDRRFAAWGSGLLAVYVGLAGVVYPAQPSSPGILWGGLALVWGIAFVATFEWTTRT